jgi:hypothetical protein
MLHTGGVGVDDLGVDKGRMEEHRDRSMLRPPRGRGKAVQIGGDGDAQDRRRGAAALGLLVGARVGTGFESGKEQGAGSHVTAGFKHVRRKLGAAKRRAQSRNLVPR